MSLEKVCSILLFILLAGWSVPKADAATLADNGNKTVTDSKTGLIWQQEEPGVMTWGNALTYCEGLTLGGADDWRLPNLKELESLLDDSRFNPAIDTTYFPNAVSSDYWSSTGNANYPGSAWYVDFNEDYALYYYKDSNYYVRCVRGGQSGAGGGAPQIPSTPVGPFEMLVLTVAGIAGYGFWKMRKLKMDSLA